MNKFTALLTAATVSLAATSAHADVILVRTYVDIKQLAEDYGYFTEETATLAANGWVGYKLTLKAVGDSVGKGVAGVKFYEEEGDGITGLFHQQWNIPVGQGSSVTNASATPSGILTSASGLDSFWITSNFFSIQNEATENNLKKNNGPNVPEDLESYDRSPLINIPAAGPYPGYCFGVGTLMTISGSFIPIMEHGEGQGIWPDEVDFAFIIVPIGSTVTISGTVNDGGRNSYAFFESFIAVPEPTSLALIALGTIPLLARRRRCI